MGFHWCLKSMYTFWSWNVKDDFYSLPELLSRNVEKSGQVLRNLHWWQARWSEFQQWADDSANVEASLQKKLKTLFNTAPGSKGSVSEGTLPCSTIRYSINAAVWWKSTFVKHHVTSRQSWSSLICSINEHTYETESGSKWAHFTMCIESQK